jgi:hypothetical protein
MFYFDECVHRREIVMERQPDRDTIAEEAIGQRHRTAPPYAANNPEMSQEEAVRQLAVSSGAQASTPEKTAESIGERVGDAYSDPQTLRRDSQGKLGRFTATRDGSHNDRFPSAGRDAGESVFNRFYNGRLATVVASFALGYATAVWFHHRINTRSENVPGPFQITKPPQGDTHPRGFIQATVLKTITEHPQGLAMAEIIAELGAQGIGPQSIANALGTLVQAKKITSERRGGKYFPAASEVPTAPDQPSS